MPDIVATFGELVEAGYLVLGDGYRTKRSEYGKPGMPILRVAEVLDGRISPRFEDYVSETYRSAIGPKLSRADDIVLTTKGTVGRVALMPATTQGFVYSPQLCYFRLAAESPIKPRYLYYWFKGDSFLSQASPRKSQTDMADYINLADIRSLEIRIPPESVQRAILDVLGALDDKIAVNDRITRCADDLRGLKLVHFINTQPEQTTRTSLLEVAGFVNGRAFTKDATGTGRMVVRIAELNSGPGGSTVYNDIEVADEYLARPGDVLFAWSGSLTVARWSRSEAIVNQHIFKVVPRQAVPGWLVFDLLSRELPEFRSIAADKATTMGHIQRRHLDRQVSIPNRTALPELDAQLGALWDRALAAEMESLMLIELRDTLLPKLMSGAIRVRDAEKVVEEAT